MGVTKSSAYMPQLLGWCFVGLLTVREGVLWLLPALGTLSYWVSLFILDMTALGLTYCIWCCPVWLLSFGGLVFSEEETEGGCICRRREVKGSGRSGRRVTVVRDVLYKRWIFSVKKKKKEVLDNRKGSQQESIFKKGGMGESGLGFRKFEVLDALH